MGPPGRWGPLELSPPFTPLATALSGGIRSGVQKLSYSEQNDAGGLHGVFRGQHNPTVIHSAIKIRVWRSSNGEVPLKQVILMNTGQSYQTLAQVTHSVMSIKTTWWWPTWKLAHTEIKIDLQRIINKTIITILNDISSASPPVAERDNVLSGPGALLPLSSASSQLRNKQTKDCCWSCHTDLSLNCALMSISATNIQYTDWLSVKSKAWCWWL